MRKRVSASPVISAVACLCTAVSLAAQSGATNGEWRHYGGDTGNTRYSPLAQITAANFKDLQVAWRFKPDALGPRPEYQFESTPLMVGGVVYTTAGTRRDVVALDAATGEMIWMHSEREGARGAAAPRQLSGRGLSYWSDGRPGSTDARIVYVTPGYRMVALDAKTGIPVDSFGEHGVVDLKKDDDQVIDLVTGEVGLHATPMITKDVVIVGAAHRSGGVPRSKENVKGFIRGFDVRTGKRLWIFHTIPSPGEYGNDTWLKDSWAYTGNAGVWAEISVDEDLGLAYLPVELPTGDYYGGHRPGNGLFGESIVAVDVKTGARKWHFQLVHHGIWDFDIPCAPILADVTVNGRAIKAVAQPTKQGWLYVLDRATGQPVWPIEERPVAKGDVPGEWYAPTQPFVTRPPAYERQGVAIDDLIDFTPELRAQATEFVKKYKIGPLFTPPVVSKVEGPLAMLMQSFASNWPGGSYDPELHYVFVHSQAGATPLGLVKPADPKIDFDWVQGSAATGMRTTLGSGGGAGADAPAADRAAANARAAAPAGEGGGGGLTISGLPLTKPPYGSITAIDLTKGDIAWRVAHGETPDNIRNHPALKGLTIRRTGQAGNVGTLVTKTVVVAGDPRVTTINGTRGAMLRAYDKSTGAEVGTVLMPAPQSGSPMTYMWNGRQYLLVAISGGNYSAELLAFRLPNSF